MSIAILPEAVTGPQSIRSIVSRLGAGFQHMQALSAEVAAFDAVSQDICHTHAMIRRDVANTVLQTAFSVKRVQEDVLDAAGVETSVDASQTDSETHVPDKWAKRLLRWADQLGRDLFGLPSARSQTVKENPALLPPQEH